ncbi:MAG: hypothetical protein QXS03_01015, partial [Candidatus Micrarchaeaceae archaeon]
MVPFSDYSIAVLLVSIMIAISGIILGIGIALDDRKLKDFGKEELYQALISGFIVGTIFTLVAPGGAIFSLINTFASTSSSHCITLISSNYVICFAYSFLTSPLPITINNISYPSLMSISISMILA